MELFLKVKRAYLKPSSNLLSIPEPDLVNDSKHSNRSTDTCSKTPVSIMRIYACKTQFCDPVRVIPTGIVTFDGSNLSIVSPQGAFSWIMVVKASRHHYHTNFHWLNPDCRYRNLLLYCCYRCLLMHLL